MTKANKTAAAPSVTPAPAPWEAGVPATPQPADTQAPAPESATELPENASHDSDSTPVAANASPEATAPSPSAAKPVVEGEVVTVTVPKAFILRVDHHNMINVKAGVQEMLLAHAEHWYSKANGVAIYTK